MSQVVGAITVLVLIDSFTQNIALYIYRSTLHAVYSLYLRRLTVLSHHTPSAVLSHCACVV